MSDIKLYRSASDRMLGGVCGGLAKYLGADSTLVRLAFAVFLFLGLSPLVYILLWIIMPLEPAMGQVPILPAEQPTTTPAITSQDPTGEWRYDPYTGEMIRRDQTES
ncbi:MAG: PspC domain-containing protein [Chloroflexaceae bacterium]|nr:PspC domain-containing protein [Chloroflexaceae bacterium]NJL34198.1 PspC domain-containing protein [Chloroflexaceae bacterium]NJO04205.1 PspC domain-containing protein [Chloroflexaceae bacterium]